MKLKIKYPLVTDRHRADIERSCDLGRVPGAIHKRDAFDDYFTAIQVELRDVAASIDPDWTGIRFWHYPPDEGWLTVYEILPSGILLGPDDLPGPEYPVGVAR